MVNIFAIQSSDYRNFKDNKNRNTLDQRLDSKRVGDTRSMTTLGTRDNVGARNCHLASDLSIVVGTNTRYTVGNNIINYLS